MTKKDFFRLIIKIFGLYSVIAFFFSTFPTNILFIIQNIDAVGIAWILCVLIMMIFIFLFLIYHPNKIINWLKLDKGFDDEMIDLQNINNLSILKLAVIVIGGILLIQNIPAFLSYTLFAFQSSNGNELNEINFGSLKDYVYWGASFIKILIGYFMLTNFNFISRILREKNKEGVRTD